VIDREELAESYSLPSIIPNSQTAGFDVVLCSKNLGNFKNNVKYLINEKHEFEF
jgi:hypothetical protein